MSNRTLNFLILAGAALLLGIIFVAAGIEDTATNDVEVTAINRDIYLPGIEFTTLSDSENEILQRCTDSSNTIVYEFALATFSGQDEDLRTLGKIAFKQCLKVYSMHVAGVE